MRTSPLAALALGVLATTLVTVLAAGCGDLYSDPTTDPSAQPLPPSASAGAFFDAAANVPRDLVKACPAAAPLEGGWCAQVGSVCEYGASPDTRCNTTLACQASSLGEATWVARPSTLCPSYECPKGDDGGALDGTPCGLPTSEAGAPSDADELVCPVGDGVCACTTGPDAAHAHERRWVCARPPSGCPSKRPLAGAACTAPRICDYGSCSFKRGLRMECVSFVWTTGSATCN